MVEVGVLKKGKFGRLHRLECCMFKGDMSC